MKEEVKVLKYDKVELVGAAKEEAFKSAPFFVQGDATQAYKNWESKQEGSITEAMKNDFYMDYLKKKSKFAPGTGFAIVLQSAVEDTRVRPYSIEDVKNEKGKRKYKTGYQGINPATGEILFTNFETKNKAKEVAKELYTKKDYKGDIFCKYIKDVVEGEVGAFEVKYTPSKSAKQGTYICFGVEA